ncbi:receptor-like protein kinase HSL1 [Daucus carota subsp. sativus]|uniref:receptor-like protein kinase HSL1 n=1 Tax=Daucus carota subsp. sativus TaxID=79200 RepID=UPI003083A691
MASTFLLLVLLLVSFAPRLSFSLNQEAACLHEIKLFHFDDPDNVLSDWILKENDTRCHWFGITCDRLTLSVNSINLSNAHIAGAFPSSLLCLGLPNLNFVILANNSINSTLSDDISTCRSLQYLDLSQNLLTGKLPATLPNIPHIIHIDFSGNSFFGDVPASFGMFRTIETIFLSQNFLDGAIPEFLGNISSLKQLDLSMNQLLPSRIPPGLGALDEDNLTETVAAGKVFKVVLSNADAVAVKKIWDGSKLADEKGDVERCGSVQNEGSNHRLRRSESLLPINHPSMRRALDMLLEIGGFRSQMKNLRRNDEMSPYYDKDASIKEVEAKDT